MLSWVVLYEAVVGVVSATVVEEAVLLAVVEMEVAATADLLDLGFHFLRADDGNVFIGAAEEVDRGWEIWIEVVEG